MFRNKYSDRSASPSKHIANYSQSSTVVRVLKF